MQVKDTQLEFSSSLKTRSNTRRIIIHHSASKDVPAQEIHRWHLANEWAGIGYHYVVRSDGTIERGRPEDTVGAHSGTEGNPDSIGICLTGNFTETAPAEAQIDSLVWLIQDIILRYGELNVIGHCDVMATACPGKLFPWQDLHNRLSSQVDDLPEPWKMEIMDEARELGLINSDHHPDEGADKWFVLAVALNLFKLTTKLV